MKSITIEGIKVTISEDISEYSGFTIFNEKIWDIEVFGHNKIVLTRRKFRERLTLDGSYKVLLPKIWIPCSFTHIEDKNIHYSDLIEVNDINSIYFKASE